MNFKSHSNSNFNSDISNINIKNIDTEKLALLEWMQIPVWLPRNPAALVSPSPKQYMLLTGLEGEWKAHIPAIQDAQLQMLKRLIQALGWDYEACVITEWQQSIEHSVNNWVERFSTITKVIVFGGAPLSLPLQKSLELNLNLELIQIDSIAELMQNPAAKRKAWEWLAPRFKVI